jgi:hypothetical protein
MEPIDEADTDRGERKGGAVPALPFGVSGSLVCLLNSGAKNPFLGGRALPICWGQAKHQTETVKLPASSLPRACLLCTYARAVQSNVKGWYKIVVRELGND